MSDFKRRRIRDLRAALREMVLAGASSCYDKSDRELAARNAALDVLRVDLVGPEGYEDEPRLVRRVTETGLSADDKEWADLAYRVAADARWATVACRACGAAPRRPCTRANARVPSIFAHVERYADVGFAVGDGITLEAAHALLPVGSIIVHAGVELECIAVEGTSLHAWRSWQGTCTIGGGSEALIRRIGGTT